FSNTQTAKIGDFGLAVVAEHAAEARSEIWGTPYYVAPERLDNAVEDFRSDIYSLGATLFHALAGRPPMEGETTSASELRKLKSNPPGLRSVAPEVSRDTARVIDRMIAPDPAQRFASYAELIAELEHSLGEIVGGKGKSKWPLLVSLLVLFALLLGGGAFLLQKRKHAPMPVASRTPAPSATPDNSAALQKRYEEARRQLLAGNFDGAATAFTRLAADAPNHQPLLSWTRLHLGLADLLQGKIEPARAAFQEMERAGPSSLTTSNPALATFFSDNAKALAAPGPIRGGSDVDAKGVSAFALFLDGVKDWQLREFDEAAGFFRRFLETEVPNELKWIADYKPLAQKYLDDHALYAQWRALPNRLSSAAEARTALEKIRALEQRVQTRGALVDAFKDDEKRLDATAAKLETTEREARERIAKEEFEKRKPALLAEWKTKLVRDLAKGTYAASIPMGATTYQGISGANEREITLRIAPYGGAPVTWDKFPPSILLSIARTFIRPGAPDTAEREWLSAIYAQSTGQPEVARTLAEEAAKAKPEYTEPMRWLFEEP
ncbi:MAG: protein kinase, partial [Verrucomicrobiota bacterium]|nr:protein kinase [Verrucomicrobiota bacterium]